MPENNVNHDAADAPWRGFAKDNEKQRLADLAAREALKNASINEIMAERARIRRRCIKRMQREKGKQ